MKYEVTVFIESDLYVPYTAYMGKHIQDVVNTGCFTRADWFTIKPETEEKTGFVITYDYSEGVARVFEFDPL